MKTYLKFRSIFRFCLLSFLPVVVFSCKKPPRKDPFKIFEESTAAVYGPYRVIKLPIENGVKVLNPIQISLGPGSAIFGANQSGEIYTLQDSDGDGVEDKALLYFDLNELGLRSPGGFAHRGDTVYIDTSPEIRVFLDTNQDYKAVTSWTFFDKIPTSEHPYEWTSALNFGPDGMLYFVLTTDSWNPGASPDSLGMKGSILRISPDSAEFEIVATGIRPINGMNFNQEGDLFFADNKGGGNPTEEINLFRVGRFYGLNFKKYEGKFDTITPHLFSLENEVAPS